MALPFAQPLLSFPRISCYQNSRFIIMTRNLAAIRVVLMSLLTTIRPSHADWLADLLNFVTSPVTGAIADIAEDGCQDVIDALFNNSAVDCSCDGTFIATEKFELTLQCSLRDGVCLFDDLFCGFPTFEAVITPTGIHKITPCLTFEKDESLRMDPPEPFCLTGYGSNLFSDTPFAIKSCAVELDGDSCECTVCENQMSLKYDCSMNTVETPAQEYITDLPGPKMDLCLGVGTVEEVLAFFFPPPPTPTISPMPSDTPSSHPSITPSLSPSGSPGAMEGEADVWGWLPWNWK